MDQAAVARYEQEERELLQELSFAGERGLQVVLDGQGIDGHTITLTRLVNFVDPLQRAFVHVAAQDVRSAGETFGDEERRLAEARLERTFDGSFGLLIGGPSLSASGEQLEFLRPTLFERSVEKILDVLAAALRENVDEALVDEAVGMNASALGALSDLTGSMAASAAPTRIAWRGVVHDTERLLTLLPRQARELQEALQAVEPSVSLRSISGTLHAVDNKDGTFHLVTDDGDDIKGVIVEGHLHAAMDGVYKKVVGTLDVHEAIGRFNIRSRRPKYFLRDLEVRA